MVKAARQKKWSKSTSPSVSKSGPIGDAVPSSPPIARDIKLAEGSWVTVPRSTLVSTPLVLPEFASMRHAMLHGFSLAGDRGYTDEQAAKAARVNLRSCFWKRAGELRKFGYIEPVRIASGPDKGWQEMRKGDLGGTQGVWRITTAGTQQLGLWG